VTDERAMRFGYLLSEIELRARLIRDGRARDTMASLALIQVHLAEATKIFAEVSREALDKVTRKVGDVPSEDIEEALRRYEPEKPATRLKRPCVCADCREEGKGSGQMLTDPMEEEDL
jgi:hypothetical protein